MTIEILLNSKTPLAEDIDKNVPNLINFILSEEIQSGTWEIKFDHESILYHYQLIIHKKNNRTLAEHGHVLFKYSNKLKKIAMRKSNCACFLGNKPPCKKELNTHDYITRAFDNNKNPEFFLIPYLNKDWTKTLTEDSI